MLASIFAFSPCLQEVQRPPAKGNKVRQGILVPGPSRLFGWSTVRVFETENRGPPEAAVSATGLPLAQRV